MSGSPQRRSGRVVVVGSINVDLVVRTPFLPRPGETVVGGRFSTAQGGKGANQAVAAARTGGMTTLIARVGDDAMGRAALESLRGEGIDTRFVTTTAGSSTGVALILIAAGGENSIAVAGGANERLSPADVEVARETIESADVLLVQLEVSLDVVACAVGIARAAGRTVILNPAPARSIPPALLRQVDILTPNTTEAATLVGMEADATPASLVELLLRQGPNAVVLTRGAEGALMGHGDERAAFPAFPVTAIDTVAAGDVFNGAMAVALAEGDELPVAIRFASAAAAISVTREGAQASAPTRDEIEACLDAATRGRV